MATYYTSKVSLNTAGMNTIPPKYTETDVVSVMCVLVLPIGTQLNAGDTIQVMDVPGNVYVTGFAVDTGKLDGSGSPTLTLSVGDAANTTRYLNASTVGQAGGYSGVATSTNGILNLNYGVTTRVYATVGTGAAAALTAAARLVVKLDYTADS